MPKRFRIWSFELAMRGSRVCAHRGKQKTNLEGEILSLKGRREGSKKWDLADALHTPPLFSCNPASPNPPPLGDWGNSSARGSVSIFPAAAKGSRDGLVTIRTFFPTNVFCEWVKRTKDRESKNEALISVEEKPPKRKGICNRMQASQKGTGGGGNVRGERARGRQSFTSEKP